MIADEILKLVRLRGVGKTICPSEVARSLFPDNWREHMDEVREVGRRLASDGEIVVMQKGQPVEIDSARGPIRFGLPLE
ncbi:MAG: DUF3253 domain-containing protein [Planctomycetaceae bacterium]